MCVYKHGSFRHAIATVCPHVMPGQWVLL